MLLCVHWWALEKSRHECRDGRQECLRHTAQHSTTQHSTAQHNTEQHSTAQHSTEQHNTTQNSTTQHSTAEHYTAHQLNLERRDSAWIAPSGLSSCLNIRYRSRPVASISLERAAMDSTSSAV